MTTTAVGGAVRTAEAEAAAEVAAVRLGWVTSTDLLGDVLGAVVGGTALLSSPRRFFVAQVEESGVCLDPDGPVDLFDVFEARVFTPDRELRWVRRGVSGESVLLGEQVTSDSPLGSGTDRTVDEAVGLEPLDGGYLLWGGPAPDDQQRLGWRTLASAQIGSLRVPGHWSDPKPARLSLATREYIAIDERYGNAYVLEERLVGLVDGEVVGG